MDERPPAEEPVDTPSESGTPTIRDRMAKGKFEAIRSFGTLGSIGFAFAIAIGLGVLIGRWIDRITGWSPWGLIVFFILGVIAGIMNVYRMSSRLK